MAREGSTSDGLMPGADFLITTILALNIHCSSCILHIRKIFEAMKEDVFLVEVSIVSHEVRIQHSKQLSLEDLCRMLSEEAFEVHYARTIDAHGSEVSTKEVPLPDVRDRWSRPSLQASLGSSKGRLPPGSDDSKRKHHLEHCAACREIESDPLSSLEKEKNSSPAFRGKLESTSEAIQGPTVERYRATVSISGMTCASCIANISDGLNNLPFVQHANIVLMTNSGEVEFTEREKLDEIIETIEDRGYGCSLVSCEPVDEVRSPSQQQGHKQRVLKLQVDGMFCNHCPAKILAALQDTFGDAVIVEQGPTMKEPSLSIAYAPCPPNLTIRRIISSIDTCHETFKTTIFKSPSMEERSKQMQLRERRSILKRLAVSAVAAVPTFVIGIVLTSLLPESNAARQLLERPLWQGTSTATDWTLFILATIVMLFATDIFHRRAAKELSSLWRRGSTVPLLSRFYRFGSMNLLISAGTGVAYVSSLALLILDATSTTMQPGSNTYFDSVVFLTFFILIGRYLESYSKSKSGDAVGLLGKLRPEFATLVLTDGEMPNASSFAPPTRTQTISADLLELGDRVIVPHGSSPPADGVVESDSGSFNESALTGESLAVNKTTGDRVYVGTINAGDPITMSVTDLGGSSMLDQIVRVVQEGQTKRAPVERLADVLTAYFVPAITAVAIATYLIWLALGYSGALDSRYLNDQPGGWAYWSLEFAIAVFVVACPCGIGLAAPTALFVGVGVAAKHGILVRGGGEAFQEASELDIVVFDKTGTLTEGGDLRVTDHEVFAGHPQDLWAIVRALEEQSSHPMAKAISSFASQHDSTSIEVSSISEVPGLGIRGRLVVNSSRTYEAALGSEDFISSLDTSVVSSEISQQIASWQYQQKSTAILALCDVASDHLGEWTTSAIFATADPIRPSALPAIQALQSRGLAVYLLSGDNSTTAHAVGTSLGIPAANIFAGVLPAQKAERIAHLQAHGPCRGTSSAQRPRRVAFVGDGINDAPALLAASVGISPANGSPIALTSSSFVLMSSNLLDIPLLLDLSVRVFRRIKFNFFWALVYNTLLIPIAAGVLFKVRDDGWRLSPVWASVAMAGSSVSVVMSSLLLRWEWRR